MPNFKKVGGRIFGVGFNAKEQEAIDREIKAQLAEYDKKHMREVDAIVLWELRRLFGFGYKRLRDFYFDFGDAINALIARYEMDEDDAVWLATYKLKEIGIDLEQWEKELNNHENQNQERKSQVPDDRR